MVRKRAKGKCCREAPDIEETKEHVMAAGKEILCAARGALRFCKDYVEASASQESKPALISFFQKAITVADELSGSIAAVSAFKETAREAAKPVLDAIAKEMMSEKAPYGRKRKCRKRKPGTRKRG